MGSFTPPPVFRFANKLVTPLIRIGLPMGVRRAPMALLTVRGRKSGLPRTTPVALVAFGSGWLLVSVYGVSDWSRNLEAAGEAEVSTRGETTRVDVRRLPPSEAAPVLQESIAHAPELIRRMTSQYFDASLESPLAEWERAAVEHPVFVLTPA
jgi:deazaflavin-dependent oxidoreductase (nitroreductase family)